MDKHRSKLNRELTAIVRPKKTSMDKERLIKLVQEAKDGCNDALTEILKANRGLIFQAVRRHIKIEDKDFEETFQEAKIAFCKCIGSYDPAKGVRPFTFAKKRVYGQIKDFLREQRRYIVKDRLPEEPYEDERMANENQPIYMALNVLPEEEKEVVSSLYGIDCPRKTLRELAEEKNVSTKKILNIANKAMDKLKEDIPTFRDCIYGVFYGE